MARQEALVAEYLAGLDAPQRETIEREAVSSFPDLEGVLREAMITNHVMKLIEPVGCTT